MVYSQQQFQLSHTLTYEAALAFVRQPHLSLRHVHFLYQLNFDQAPEGGILSGKLRLRIPVIGEVTLPFRSQLQHTETGAILIPDTSSDARLWVEVGGLATVKEELLQFDFEFRAHLPTNETEWGTKAFEKMVDAAANRTLARVSGALPEALTQALQEQAIKENQ